MVSRNASYPEYSAISFVFEDAGHGGGDERGPARDRHQDDDGGGGRVDEVGELRPGDPVLVGDRPADVAAYQAAEGVVEEDHDAHQDRYQLCLHAGAYLRDRPFGEGAETTGDVDEGGQHPQQEDEGEDVHLLGDGALGDDQNAGHVVDEFDAGDDVPPGAHQGAEHDADREGQQDPSGGNGQPDSDDRREQRKDRRFHGRTPDLVRLVPVGCRVGLVRNEVGHEPPQTLHLTLDLVSRLQPDLVLHAEDHSFGRSGEDEVSWLQRHDL